MEKMEKIGVLEVGHGGSSFLRYACYRNVSGNGKYRNCYTFNLEKSIVIAIFNSKNVANVNHLSTEILCG